MEAGISKKRATIEDIVRLSGVSRSSVFRYLSGKPLKPALQEAVKFAMRNTGYSPEAEAEERAREILISAPAAVGGFRGYADHVDGIMARAMERGIRIRLASRQAGKPDGLSGLVAELLGEAAGMSGVIILGTTIAEEEGDVQALRKRGLPFVLINRVIDEEGISYVSPDFKAAAREAVAHLLSAGRKRVALWDDGSASYRMQKDKLSGYLAAHERAGIEASPALVVPRGEEPLESVVSRLLSGREPPDAWFSMDDHAAMRVIRVARRRGLRVPEDLAVVGMNDIEPASFAHPSISSVSLPFFEAGKTAVDVLSRLAARHCESVIRVTLGHSLKVRESSGGTVEAERGAV